MCSRKMVSVTTILYYLPTQNYWYEATVFKLYYVDVTHLLEVIGEAVDLRWKDFDDGEPKSDPRVAVLGAVEVRDQRVIEPCFQSATQYSGNCAKSNALFISLVVLIMKKQNLISLRKY